VHISGTLVASVFAVALVWAAYVVLALSSSWGATIGMHLLKLKVTTVDFKRIGIGRSLLRAVIERAIEVLNTFLFVVTLLDVLWPLWDSKHQTLHDKVVGTVVLDVRRGDPSRNLPLGADASH
jgi:uncharacterized RDD family membrane protein YckC